MTRRRAIDWSAVFASMVKTGEGPRATAERFGLPAGTVLSAVWRERLQPCGGRLAGYVHGDAGVVPRVEG